MKKTLITVAVATLALSSATLATADETVAVVAPTPIISGAVSLDFAETATNKTAGTMGVELDIDAGELATVDLDFKATDGGSLTLDTWTVGTTAGAVALAFGDSNGLLPETGANTTADGTLNVSTMTESLQVTMGAASVAVGLTNWTTDVTEVNHLQGAYTVNAGDLALTASADYNRTTENTVLGGAVSGLEIAGLSAGGLMTYDTDASKMAYEGSLALNGLSTYINGDDDNKLQHIGGEYVVAWNGAELSAGVDYDTDSKDVSPQAGIKFKF